jgi:phenylalanyl-tRNA synthetase alpha chain
VKNKNNFYLEFVNCKTVNDCLKVKDMISNSDKFSEIKAALKSSSPENKKELGFELTILNKELKEALDDKIIFIQNEGEKNIYFDFDPTFSSKLLINKNANLHPLTLVMEDLVGIFTKMNFEIAKGPLVETQWHNFTSLNMGKYHPARAMQDTFYLKNKDKNDECLLLRTQTSAVQVRFGLENKPPFKVVVPGMVYRNEDIDATHDINFYQLECMYVDKNVSMAQLKTLILEVFESFFNKKMNIRLRPSFFPFVNPGMEGDISCPFCDGKGCKICKETGWIECFGAGLVHPNVISNMGLDNQEWQGLAFAFGVDRMAQFKLGVSGISQFYNARLDFFK